MENKLEEIIESNLSADTKVELMKLLLRDRDREEEKPTQPFFIENEKGFYQKIDPNKVTASDWWKQQMEKKTV